MCHARSVSQAAYLLTAMAYLRQVREADAVAAAQHSGAAARGPRRGREDSGWRDEWIMAWTPEGTRQLAGTNAD